MQMGSHNSTRYVLAFVLPGLSFYLVAVLICVNGPGLEISTVSARDGMRHECTLSQLDDCQYSELTAHLHLGVESKIRRNGHLPETFCYTIFIYRVHFSDQTFFITR